MRFFFAFSPNMLELQEEEKRNMFLNSMFLFIERITVDFKIKDSYLFWCEE